MPRLIQLIMLLDTYGASSSDSFWAMIVTCVAKCAFNVRDFNPNYTPFNERCEPESVGLPQQI